MKLYAIPGACSTAAHIALQWTGEAYDVEIVTPEMLHSLYFRTINPAGAVPALVDGDFVLTQNAAILGYIADRYPHTQLFGDGSPRQRAEITRWLMLGNTDMHPVFGTFFDPQLFIEDAAQHEALQAASRVRLMGMFRLADAQLHDKEWFAGSRSVADAYLYIMLRWADILRFDLSGLTRLLAFRKRMESDASVQAALAAEGLSH